MVPETVKTLGSRVTKIDASEDREKRIDLAAARVLRRYSRIVNFVHYKDKLSARNILVDPIYSITSALTCPWQPAPNHLKLLFVVANRPTQLRSCRLVGSAVIDK